MLNENCHDFSSHETILAYIFSCLSLCFLVPGPHSIVPLSLSLLQGLLQGLLRGLRANPCTTGSSGVDLLGELIKHRGAMHHYTCCDIKVFYHQLVLNLTALCGMWFEDRTHMKWIGSSAMKPCSFLIKLVNILWWYKRFAVFSYLGCLGCEESPFLGPNRAVWSLFDSMNFQRRSLPLWK